MVRLEVIDRVFNIRFGTSQGTGFALDVDGRQYLVTAKHVVVDFHGSGVLSIPHGGHWRDIRMRLVGHGSADVSVVAAETQLAHAGAEMILEARAGGFFLGQDVYFAGFPYGLWTESAGSSFPAPLVKKAVVSGREPGGKEKPFYLDGHGNPGFSGGPVFFQSHPNANPVVCMVISATVSAPEPVWDAEARHEEYAVHANTGIIKACSIIHALELIEANPVGYKL